MSMRWLLERVPGLARLPAEDLDAIVTFTLLWTLFESRAMDCSGSAAKIVAMVDEWARTAKLHADEYLGELAYFRQRYYANGAFTHRFRHLRLRNGDQRPIVESVLDGSNHDERDQVLTVLMIVWRYRNNLFHGMKWGDDLAGQLENFNHANAVLMRVIERHGVLLDRQR